MKKLSIMGGILFALGMLVATGIDVNPVQAIYALVLMVGGAVCFSYSKNTEYTEKTEGTEAPSNSPRGGKVIDAVLEDAA